MVLTYGWVRGVCSLKVEKYAVVERSLQLEDPQPTVIWPAEVGPSGTHSAITGTRIHRGPTPIHISHHADHKELHLL